MKADAINKTKRVSESSSLLQLSVFPLYAMEGIVQYKSLPPKKAQSRFYNLTVIQISIPTNFSS